MYYKVISVGMIQPNRLCMINYTEEREKKREFFHEMRLNKRNHLILLNMESACYSKSNSKETGRKLVVSYSLLYFTFSIYNN